MNTLKERLASAMAGPPKIGQSELARAVGVKQPTVNDWLSGKSQTIRSDILIAVAKRLNVNPSWLATGKGQRDVNVKNSYEGMPTGSRSATFDVAILSRALVWFDYELKAYGPTQYLRQAQRLIELYQQVEADGGDLTPDHIEEITEAVRLHKRKTGVKSDGGVKRARGH